jgi:hypothetical protein
MGFLRVLHLYFEADFTRDDAREDFGRSPVLAVMALPGLAQRLLRALRVAGFFATRVFALGAARFAAALFLGDGSNGFMTVSSASFCI